MEQMNQQYQQPPQGYTPPPQYNAYNFNAPLSVGQYIGMFIVMAIPLVNIIMLFVWAFGEGNINKKNFAKATLVMALIAVVIYIIIFVAAGSVFINMFNNMGGFGFWG